MQRTSNAVALAIAIAMASARPASAGQVFGENWELGIGSWNVTNGVWDVGQPTSGPLSAHEGQFCAGTNLSGPYPDNSDTRLESPQIQLPFVSAGEQLEVRFWQWFSVQQNAFGSDYGYVELYRYSTGTWTTLSGSYGPFSRNWTRCALDLMPYQGEQIKLGFHFYSNYRDVDDGWFIDEITVLSYVPDFPNPETFENGLGDDSASNGVWEVGIPTYGPTFTPSGQACAATNLSGAFWPNTESRFEGPTFQVKVRTGETPELQVDHWFQLPNNAFGSDVGSIQILDVTTGAAWLTLQSFSGSSSGPGGWQHQRYDLSAYAGDFIKIGFLFSSNYRDEAAGWYVDNVQVSGIENHLRVQLSEFGQGLGGTGGFVPHLYGSDGNATGGFVVRCDGMLGGALVIIWAGLGQTNVPFKGGEFYVDLGQPFAIVPFTANGPAGVAGAGYFNFTGPDVTPLEGLTFTTQVTVIDAGAPHGVALSNGLDVAVTRQ